MPRIRLLAGVVWLIQNAASSASIEPDGLRSGVWTVGETVAVPPVGRVVDVVVVEEVVVDDVVVEEVVVDEVVVELVLEVVVLELSGAVELEEDEEDEDEDDDDEVVVPPPPEEAGKSATASSATPPEVEKSPTAASVVPSLSRASIPAMPFVVGWKSGSSAPSVAAAAIRRSLVSPL